MEKLKFNTTINAPRDKVWNALWDGDNYRKWTTVFSEGSTVETDWKKGSKVLFTDGKGSGMVSEIADNIPNEYMSFRHLGMLQDGVEDTTSEKVKDWAGSMENYRLKDMDGKTELEVELDIVAEHKDYFNSAFPKALQLVKEISEQ